MGPNRRPDDGCAKHMPLRSERGHTSQRSASRHNQTGAIQDRERSDSICGASALGPPGSGDVTGRARLRFDVSGSVVPSGWSKRQTAMTMNDSRDARRNATDELVALLSRSEGVEYVEWRPSRGEPCIARNGHRAPERALRQARRGPQRLRSVDPRGRGTLSVLVDAPHREGALRLEAFVELLGTSSAPRSEASTAASERLHDLAHLVHRARLELASESSDGRCAANEALRQFEAEAAEERSSEASNSLRQLVEREFRNARASVSVLDPLGLVLDIDASLRTRLSTALLGRAIRNLLVNALQASPRGARVHVAASRSGSEVRLRIRDDGRGVSRSEAQLLSRATASHVRGSGLGLRSLAACARQLGIEVRFESARAAGTAVHLRWNEPEVVPATGFVAACPAAFGPLITKLRGAGDAVVCVRSLEELRYRTNVAQLKVLVVARGTPGIAPFVARARSVGPPIRLVSAASSPA